MNQQPKTWQIILALLSVYLIWGSTYLAIKITVGEHDFPPLLMGGIRHLTAGGILFAFLRMRGEALPNRSEWIGASVMGFFLLLGGNGGVVIAESDPLIGSGLAALVIATMPLWAALFSTLFGHRLAWREWLGLLIGFSGIVLLNLNGNLNWSTGAIALVIAAMSWAFGSTISRKVDSAQRIHGERGADARRWHDHDHCEFFCGVTDDACATLGSDCGIGVFDSLRLGDRV